MATTTKQSNNINLTQNEMEIHEFLQKSGKLIKNIEMLNGYFTLLSFIDSVASPIEKMSIMKRISLVWEGAVFESENQIQRIAVYLFEYWNLIQNRASTEKVRFIPSIIMDNTDSVFAQDWAIGFLFGITKFPDECEKIFANEQRYPKIMPIEALATDQKTWEITPTSTDPRRLILSRKDMLNWAVREITVLYEMLGSMKNIQSTSTKNTQNTKVGRNDPCPCGSGLKYKRCCALKI
jgi:uncharacterized protein